MGDLFLDFRDHIWLPIYANGSNIELKYSTMENQMIGYAFPDWTPMTIYCTTLPPVLSIVWFFTES